MHLSSFSFSIMKLFVSHLYSHSSPNSTISRLPLTLSLPHTFSVYFTMVNMNDYPISLSSDSGSSDSSSLVMAEMYSSSNYYHIVTNPTILVVIHVFHDSKSQKLSSGSLGRETSISGSSFDTSFSNDDVADDPVINYMLASLKVTGVLASPTLLTLEMEFTILNREDAKNLVKTYQDFYYRDLSDTEIKDNLARGAQSDGISWLNPFMICNADKIHLKVVMLVESTDVIKYSWVDTKVVGALSVLSDSMIISATKIIVDHLLTSQFFRWTQA